MITLTDVGNRVIILRTRLSRVNHLANKIADQWRKAGVRPTNLLNELRRIRK